MYAVLILMACSIGGVAVWAMVRLIFNHFLPSRHHSSIFALVVLFFQHFVGMSAVSFTDPDDNAMILRYRYDYTIISLVVILLLCFAGIYLCAIDPAYIIDKNDTIDNFIANAGKPSLSKHSP